MANPIVTSLPAYVEQNAVGLIAKSVLGSRSVGLMSLQTGIKDSAALNLVSTDVKFGDGKSCGWTAAGSSTLSQRVLKTGHIKINTAFCDKQLLGTYAEHGVKVAAGQKSLPFEEDFINGIIDGVNEAIEKAIWQGDTESEDVNLNKFDGFLKIIAAEDGVIKKELTGATMYSAVKEAVKALPARALKEDTTVYVGMEKFAQLVDEMVAANLYHYSADTDGYSFTLPASNIRVEGVAGLNDTNKIVVARKSNLYVGCDMAGDAETFKFWYSEDNREFRLAIEFNEGVQVALPDEIVLVTLA